MNQEVSILDPVTAPGKQTFRLAPVAKFCPSPPACGGRGRVRWVAPLFGTRGCPHLTPTLSAPEGGEGEISGARLLAKFVHIQVRGFWGDFQDEQPNGYRRAAPPVGFDDPCALEAVSGPGRRYDGSGLSGGRGAHPGHAGGRNICRLAVLCRRALPGGLGVAFTANAGLCLVISGRGAGDRARRDIDRATARRRTELDDGIGGVLRRRGRCLDRR